MTILFVAVHESGPGTPRRFAAVRRFGRDRGEADMPRASGAGRSDENDRADIAALQHADPCVAVGTRVTSRPPLRSVRAAFPHTAPTSGIDGNDLPYANQR